MGRKLYPTTNENTAFLHNCVFPAFSLVDEVKVKAHVDSALADFRIFKVNNVDNMPWLP